MGKLAKNMKQFHSHFIDETKLESIDDDKTLKTLWAEPLGIIVLSGLVIFTSFPYGALPSNGLNYFFFSFEVLSYFFLIVVYSHFVHTFRLFKIFKKEKTPVLLSLPYLILPLPLFFYATYNSFLIMLGRSDYITLYSGQLVPLFLLIHFLYTLFWAYAFMNCIGEYLNRKKPTINSFHR